MSRFGLNWRSDRSILAVSCLVVMMVYGLLIDLRGISTDEGIRLGIMNGREAYSANHSTTQATWNDVLEANVGSNYQPLYFILQNSVMRITQTQSMNVLRLTNLFFLLVCLVGLIALTTSWRLMPRLFFIGLFSFNAYLFMHVLHIREYILGVAFYIWSSWLVLKLDQRSLTSFRADIGWFAIYGLSLILGFYLQTWVVFIAIGQFLFLVIRRRPNRVRFFAHLALSYGLVWYATLSYIIGNSSKVSVGRWGAEGTAVMPQLLVGFRLLFSGHVAPKTFNIFELLFWFWAAAFVAALMLIAMRWKDEISSPDDAEMKRRGLLATLCLGIALTFQIVYCLHVDNLSVWPRYFLIHYFFLTWVIALGFNALYELCFNLPPHKTLRTLTQTGAAILGVVMVVSAVAQTQSYHRQPFLDTGLSHDSNWNVWSKQLAEFTQPDDLVISHDFISRATLTFTHPFTNEVIMLHELESFDLSQTNRIVYMESSYSLHERDTLLQRMRAVGFGQFDPHPMLKASR